MLHLQEAVQSALTPFRDHRAFVFPTVGHPGYIEHVTCNDSYLVLLCLETVHVYVLQTGALLHTWSAMDLPHPTDVDQCLISTTNHIYVVCVGGVKPFGATHTVRVTTLNGQLLWSHVFDTLLQGPAVLWDDKLLLVKDNDLWSLVEGQGCVHMRELPWPIPAFCTMRVWHKTPHPQVVLATGTTMYWFSLGGPPTNFAVPLDAHNLVIMGDRLYWRERYTGRLPSVRLDASAYVPDYRATWGVHDCLIGVCIRNGRRHLVTHARDKGICQLFE